MVLPLQNTAYRVAVPQFPELSNVYPLQGAFAKAEQDDLIEMLGAVASEAGWLASKDDVRFMNDVALRQNG